MNSPETLATLGTRHRTLEKTVEGNDECTIQRHWQHWEQDCPFIIAIYGFL
jgi:hypothetical protein